MRYKLVSAELFSFHLYISQQKMTARYAQKPESLSLVANVINRIEKRESQRLEPSHRHI